MPLNDALLPEFDREMSQTRRLLERLPDDQLPWRPHEKSRTLGELAAHVAALPHWIVAIFETSVFDLETGGWQTGSASTRAELLERFDRHATAARSVLAARTDAEYLARWTLRQDGENIFTLPKMSVIRTMVLNHLIHHRGQLTIYLRMLGVPLPPLYGPTADQLP